MKKTQRKILAIIAKYPKAKCWYFGDIFGESITLTVWNGSQQLDFSFYAFRSEDWEHQLQQFTELMQTLHETTKGGAA